MTDLIVGKDYKVQHARKGVFNVRISQVNDEWVTGYIIDGQADALCEYNEKYKGDEITMRLSFCKFTQLDKN